MRKIVMALGFMLAFASPAFAADLTKNDGGGRCAAIAFGPNDKWGAESYKDTCEGAESAARGYCEKNMRDQGISGRCSQVLSSRAWVVGIACHVPGGRVSQGLGAGETPAGAIADALRKVGDAPGNRCGTTIIRSANHKWREFYATTWTVHLSCSKVVSPSELKGFTALTRALLNCDRTRANSIQVVSAQFGN